MLSALDFIEKGQYRFSIKKEPAFIRKGVLGDTYFYPAIH
jgi:hypothetical protein